MLYFFVIPAFVLAVLGMSAASILCAAVPRLRWAYPYAWRLLLWSSGGVLVGNILVIALYMVPLGLERAGVTLGTGGASNVLRVALGFGLLIGPLIASGAGYVGGAILGLRLASRAVKAYSQDARS